MKKFFYYLLILSSASVLSLIIDINSLKTDSSSYSLAVVVFVVILELGLIMRVKDLFQTFSQNYVFRSIIIFLTSLLMFLLVLLTGGLSGPFFILIHLTTLALAFLVSFKLSIIFLLVSIATTLIHFYFSFQYGLVTADISLMVIYLVSLGVIIPLSAIIARRYQVKEKAADFLMSQLIASKTEHSMVLKNIQEGVITLDKKINIVRINEMAEKLTDFTQKENRGKAFFETFQLTNNHGQILKASNFPIGKLLSEQTSIKESDITLRKKNGDLIRIEMKISSLINVKGEVEGLILIFSDNTRQLYSAQYQKILFQASGHFLQNLDSMSTQLKGQTDQETDTAISTLPSVGTRLEKTKLAFKDILTLAQIALGETGGTTTYVDVGKITRQVVTSNLEVAAKMGFNLIFVPEEKLKEGIKDQPSSGKNLWEQGTATYHPIAEVPTNEILIKEGLSKLIQLAGLLVAESIKKDVLLDLYKDPQKVTIQLNANVDQDIINSSHLFMPFYGDLLPHIKTLTGSGLEGYLASVLLSKAGAKLSVISSSGVDAKGLLFKIEIVHPIYKNLT